MSDDDIDDLLCSDDDDDLESPCLPLPLSSQPNTVDTLEPKAENDQDRSLADTIQEGATDNCKDENVPEEFPSMNMDLKDEMLMDIVDFNNEDNDNDEEEQEDLADQEVEAKLTLPVNYPPVKEELLNVFQSSSLDAAVLEGKNQSRMVPVLPNNALEGISELSAAEIEKIRLTLDEREHQEGVKAGLGHKKKAADRMGRMMTSTAYIPSKAKTLAEKRRKLQEDMMKYGVAAIERLYPRQQKDTANLKKQPRPKMPLLKMKHSSNDPDYEEVDARSIIKPFSHGKYIQEPSVETVVYINRRDGLVPLSTLALKGTSINAPSSSSSLVCGRNHALGKPACYIRDSERLLAVGGSRTSLKSDIKILTVPSFLPERKRLVPFEIDQEFAEFSASAHFRIGSRVDIRRLKKEQTLQQRNLKDKIMGQNNLVDRMMCKLKLRDTIAEIDESAEDIKGTLGKDTLLEETQGTEEGIEDDADNDSDADSSDLDPLNDSFLDQSQDSVLDVVEKKDEEGDEPDVKIEETKGRESLAEKRETIEEKLMKDIKEEKDKLHEKEEKKIPPKLEEKEDMKNILEEKEDMKKILDEKKEKKKEKKAVLVIKNSWKDLPDQAFPATLDMDECPPLRGYSEESIKSKVKPSAINSDGFTGWDTCDVPACYCKSLKTPPGTSPGGTPGTLSNSGTNTPHGLKKTKKKIAKDLLRVRRALKTLGVNIIEYDETESDDATCTRDYCKFGCVCETIKMKPIPPTHCGKVECMFQCSCSTDALKFSTCESRRVNISAAVGARIQEDTQRFMAAEEKKFNNTVLLTSGRESVMLGGRGTKRQRKIPQRYQNSTLLLDKEEKEFSHRETKESRVEQEQEEDEEEEVVEEEEAEEEEETDMESSFNKLRNNVDLIPCTVVIPKIILPKNTEVWCMYHCRYTCPCRLYENPLDYAPDVSKSRNKAKRSIGGKFITKKTVSPVKPIISEEDSRFIDELIQSDQEDEDYGADAGEDGDEVLVINEKSSRTSPLTKETANNLYSVPLGHSSRTSGLMVKQNAGMKLPYKPKFTPRFKEILSFNNSSEVKKMGELNSILKEAETVPGDPVTQLSLKIAPKQSIQYTRWDVLKEKFLKREIDIFFYVRPGRGTNLLFLCESGQKSYIASAINLRSLEGALTHKLPSLVEECLKPLNKADDMQSYAVLESNGLVWTFQSLLSSKEKPKSAQKRRRSLVVPPPPPMPKTNPSQPSGRAPTKIDVRHVSQKLPMGQPMVTLVDGDKALMQVKLPQTGMNQHWTLVSTGTGGDPTIQCPDSNLVLKCAILQQASNLASATSTTVRIPISADAQDSAFGVYAVPGLKSHVFVGPFTVKDEDGVVCLDDDDEEVVCLGEEEEIADKLVQAEEEDDRKQEDLTKRRRLSHQVRQVGQIPQLVEDAAEDKNDEDVEILDPETVNLAEELKSENIKTATAETVPVFPEYKNGKVIRKPMKSGKQENEKKEAVYNKVADGMEVEENNTEAEVEAKTVSEAKVEAKTVSEAKVEAKTVSEANVEAKTVSEAKVEAKTVSEANTEEEYTKGTKITLRYKDDGKEKIHTGLLADCGKVTLSYPLHPEYQVVCPSLPRTYLWLKEFYSSPRAKPDPAPQLNPESIAENENQNLKEDIKLLKESSPSQSSISKMTEKKLATPELPIVVRVPGKEEKKKVYGMLIQSRQEKEESKLFYDLGTLTFSKLFTKNTTKTMILNRAKTELENLNEEGRVLENSKQALMRRRAKLFDDFTKSLDGLPFDKKKLAVSNLKYLLSKKEEPASVRKQKQEPSQPSLPTSQGAECSTVSPVRPHRASPPTPYTDVTGIKTVKADGTIIKPMNAFTIWAREKKSEYISRGVHVDQLGSYLPKTWILLNDKARHRYVMEAKHLRILHKIQHPEFYASEASDTSNSVQSSTNSSSVPQELPGRSRTAPGLIPLTSSQKVNISHHDTKNISVISQAHRTSQISVQALPKPSTSNHNLVSDTQSNVSSNQNQGFIARGINVPNQRRVSLPEKALSPVEQGGTLDLSEIPSDAADVLGLALLSSGIQEMEEAPTVSHQAWAQQQYSQQQYIPANQQQFIHTGEQQQHQFIHAGEQQQVEQEHFVVMSDTGQIYNRGDEEVVHLADGGGQYIMQDGGQQLFLGQNNAGLSSQMLSSNYQENQGRRVYVQDLEGVQREVYLEQGREEEEVYLQEGGETGEVYLEQGGEEGEVFLQQGGEEGGVYMDQDQPIYVDELGRQVVFQQEQEQDQRSQPQYYMQNGELFQIIEEDVMQID